MPFSNTTETGKPIAIKDEGVTLHSSVSSIDFIGAGVTGSVIGSAITEDVSANVIGVGTAKITVASSAPSSPTAGDLWVDTL